jgi:flagellar protein FlbD
MIALTRLNKVAVLLNSDLIETVEATPDTVIRLVNGQRLLVRESPEEVMQKVSDFRRSVSVSARKFALLRAHCPPAVVGR